MKATIHVASLVGTDPVECAKSILKMAKQGIEVEFVGGVDHQPARPAAAQPNAQPAKG